MRKTGYTRRRSARALAGRRQHLTATTVAAKTMAGSKQTSAMGSATRSDSASGSSGSSTMLATGADCKLTTPADTLMA